MFKSALLLTSFSIAIAQFALADEEKKTDDAKQTDSKDAVRVLFNGKDLTGWKPITETFFKNGGEIKVIDGEIEINKGKPGSGIIVDGDNKKNLLRINYQIELDAKRTDGGDFFCGMTFPIKDDYLSMIIGGWGGKVTGLSNLNNLSAIENETTGVIDFENDKWYHIKLKVTEEKIEAWLDDEKIINVKLKDKGLSIWMEQEPVRPLGISTWYTQARVKNIKVTDLSKQVAEAEQKKPDEKDPKSSNENE